MPKGWKKNEKHEGLIDPPRTEDDARHNISLVGRAIQDLFFAVRAHRDARGHKLCFENDNELYAAFGLEPLEDRELPPRAEFLGKCAEYYDSHPCKRAHACAQVAYVPDPVIRPFEPGSDLWSEMTAVSRYLHDSEAYDQMTRRGSWTVDTTQF